MATATQHSTLLHEQNWQDVMTHITHFPMRASEIVQVNKDISLQPISFKYNLKGSETYYNQHKQLSLRTGEYLLATQQTYCEVDIRKGDQPDLGICIDIDPDLMKQALDANCPVNPSSSSTAFTNYFHESALFMRFDSNRYFHQYMQDVFVKIKQHEIVDMRSMEMEFIQQFLWMHAPEIKVFQQVPGLRKATKIELYERMVLARDYIHGHMYTLKNIAELAATTYLSEYRFYHIFKQTFGVSPYQYLLHLKLEEALRLFQTQQYTWTDIAMKLNFADLLSFSKLFKKHFRITPSAYTARFKGSIETL